MTEVTDSLPVPGALLPSYDELAYQLFVRSSWVAGEGAAPTYSKSEADALVEYMEQWLPKKVEGNIETEKETVHAVDTRTEQKLRRFDVQQRWGEIDTSEIVAAGPSFEVAGPSRRHPDENIVPDISPDFVTNITEQVTGNVDMLVNAEGLPVRPGSLGSVHVSYLMGANGEFYEEPNMLRSNAIEEAWAALRDGGFLIWDGGTLGDFDVMRSLGFVPRKLETWITIEQDVNDLAPDEGFRDAGMAISGVFQKVSHSGNGQ